MSMSLDQFLSSDGAPTAAEFAEEVGVSAMSIGRIRRGEQNITRDLMRRIILASKGRISADSLVGLTGGDGAAEAAQDPFAEAGKPLAPASSPISSRTAPPDASGATPREPTERRCSPGRAIMRQPDAGGA